MTAEVGKDDALMRFTFVEANSGYTVKGEFKGAAWKDGARLITTGEQITTQGQAKKWKQKTSGEGRRGPNNWLIIGAVIGGLVVITALLVGCCCCCIKRKRRQVQKTEPAWRQ